ncbi:MAG: hypothetical protein SCALA701_12290 [Candidatus Scalindua sp.]|nr:MAG: hypothetical protein SCALA701_12290 [Candidatus Scalindua sp.]
MSDRYDDVVLTVLSFMVFVNLMQRPEFIVLAFKILAKHERLGCKKAVSLVPGFHGQASKQVVYLFS